MEETQFDFSYAPGVTEEQILGFEMAGQIWSQYLADRATINIYVEMTDQLPENVIGGALPGMKKDIKYEKVWKEMQDDITTDDDLTAFNNFSSVDKKFTALVNGQEINKVEKMKITNANAKALGLLDGDKDKLDGYIVMSDLTGQSNVQWDYDPFRDGEIADNSLDFVSVALHEIGHVMGFVSGMDDGDWLNVVTKANEENKEFKGDAMKFSTPLDLFRYSANSAAKGQTDLSFGGNAFFSIDGGQTNLGNFSTGEYQDLGGDGYQASHWKQSDNNALGIMDPVLKLGQQREISSLDTIAMDVMGWDVVNPDRLNWEELHNDALESAEDVLVANRDKDVEKMIKESETYHGRNGRRGRRGRRNQIGLWQNIKFQTLDVEVDSFQSEADIAQVLFDNYMSQFDSGIAVQNETDDKENESTVKNEFEVEETVVQLIDNSQIVNSEFESNTLDLEMLSQLLSEKLEGVLDVDGEPLVMPLG